MILLLLFFSIHFTHIYGCVCPCKNIDILNNNMMPNTSYEYEYWMVSMNLIDDTHGKPHIITAKFSRESTNHCFSSIDENHSLEYTYSYFTDYNHSISINGTINEIGDTNNNNELDFFVNTNFIHRFYSNNQFITHIGLFFDDYIIWIELNENDVVHNYGDNGFLFEYNHCKGSYLHGDIRMNTYGKIVKNNTIILVHGTSYLEHKITSKNNDFNSITKIILHWNYGDLVAWTSKYDDITINYGLVKIVDDYFWIENNNLMINFLTYTKSNITHHTYPSSISVLIYEPFISAYAISQLVNQEILPNKWNGQSVGVILSELKSQEAIGFIQSVVDNN
jgi:hypothetical protein